MMAADLGTIEDSRSIRGSLSFWDTADVFSFEIAKPSDIRIQLDPTRVDANLAILDSGGRVLASSTRGGTATDTISGQLNAGTYFASVTAASWWRNEYALSLDVSPILVTPTPVVPAVPAEPELPLPLASVPYFGGSDDWNLNSVAAPEAWAAGYTGQGILVAVVDTGVDLDHPDLVSRLYVNPGEIPGNGVDDDGNGFIDDVSGYDFADRDGRPDDTNGHGTHVAGTIAAANNGFGVTGVAPQATILPVRVLGDEGSGSTLDVAAGIRYAADMGAHVINLSLGGGYSRAIASAVQYAEALGSFIVAAAGNESAAVPSYPARLSQAYDNVLSVGAFNSSGRIAGFSNDVGDSGGTQIDAPGVNIRSTVPGGRYANLSGTSMATPHVAGVAALALSANPNLTPSQLRDLLTGGVVDAAANSDSIGKLNAATTVAYAAAGLTTAANRVGESQTARARGNAAVARRMQTFQPTAAPVDESSRVDGKTQTPISRDSDALADRIVQDRAPRERLFAQSIDWRAGDGRADRVVIDAESVTDDDRSADGTTDADDVQTLTGDHRSTLG